LRCDLDQACCTHCTTVTLMAALTDPRQRSPYQRGL